MHESKHVVCRRTARTDIKESCAVYDVCGSDGLCCVLHCVLLCATKGRDEKSMDGMAENQRVLLSITMIL